MPGPDPIEHSRWLTIGDLDESDEALRLFVAWFDEAARAETRDPNAMALSTVGADGLPNIRMVLLKALDQRGFVFYTSADSQKGRELAGQPQAGLGFYWKSLNRQVRIRGPVTQVSDAEADAYFASRPRLSQIGAWASKQSAPLESRFALEQAVALHTAKFALGSIPRPAYWVGYRVTPLIVEFWQDRPFRLHERTEFRRATLEAPWAKTQLYP
ncbi:MAG: pyridoxamine 5-phosphate oxidase [Alphaproteobacteria bacterium]|jgi:pyridoxamine 5'-phosphate oxidase|nr:pyridoxamine 5-phosphate oxidase [Alphaproteobacteria bacterium]